MAKVSQDIQIQPDTELEPHDFRRFLRLALKKSDGLLLGKLLSNVSCPLETWKKYLWRRPECILHPLAFIWMDLGLEESERNLLILGSRWCPDASPMPDRGEELMLVASDSFEEYSVGNDRFWQAFVALIPEEERRKEPALLHNQEGEAWPSQVLELFHDKLDDPSLLDEDVATLWEYDGVVAPGIKKSILSRPGLVVEFARWTNAEFYGPFFRECLRSIDEDSSYTGAISSDVVHDSWSLPRHIEFALVALIFPDSSEEARVWAREEIRKWPDVGILHKEDYKPTPKTSNFFGKKDSFEIPVFGQEGVHRLEDMVQFVTSLPEKVRRNIVDYSYEYNEDHFQRLIISLLRDWFGMKSVVDSFRQEVSDGVTRDFAYEAWQKVRPGSASLMEREMHRLGLIYFSEKQGFDLVGLAKTYSFDITKSVFSDNP